MRETDRVLRNYNTDLVRDVFGLYCYDIRSPIPLYGWRGVDVAASVVTFVDIRERPCIHCCCCAVSSPIA